MSKLFQYNIAKMRFSFDDPRFDDFRSQLAVVHKVAEDHAGFIWRLLGENGEEGYIKPYKDPLVMGNLSAWRDYDSLYDFTFSGAHLSIMKPKRKWFEKIQGHYNVLYYHDSFENALEVAKQKLRYLRVYGETPAAFTWGFQ